MKTATGYLTAVQNPHFSGLATVVFRSAKRARKGTKFVTCYCEAGFGVRQLVAALGVYGRLTKQSGEILVRYVIDDLGVLAAVEPLD